MSEPLWIDWAREQIGVTEFAGEADNPKVVQYFRAAGLLGAPFLDDETPWCAAFVGAALAYAGHVGTKSAAARSYESWAGGHKLGGPVLGCVCVLERSPPKPGLGHVGFLIGRDLNRVALLGGNQGDSVSISSFPRSRVVGYYWPNAVPIKAEWVGPAMPTKIQGGGSVV